MDNLETNSKLVLEKLQQLLKKYMALQKENEGLKNDLDELQHKEDDNKLAIDKLQQKVNILQASSGQMTQKDQKEFEKKISQYIKEIDKCIGILSE